MQSIDSVTCADTNSDIGEAQSKIFQVQVDNAADSVTFTGTNLLDKYGEASLNLFVDPSSVIPTLEKKMSYTGIISYLESDKDPLVSVSETKIEIKKYLPLAYCRDIVMEVPEFENSGKKVRVGAGLDTNKNPDSETPDVTFEIECRDTTKKLEELKW